ncbi:MAG TPA: ABC transporter permease [Tepidisphaeraceae bacterium]|nr:ABC transporter permease [Tepidisphaeraceae bacterium]
MKDLRSNSNRLNLANVENGSPIKTKPLIPAGMARVHAILGVWTVAVLAFLYLPIVLLSVYSFNASKWASAWHGFTLDWYLQLPHNQALIDSLIHSLLVAIVTTLLATILGTMGAWVAHRYETRYQKFLDATLLLPVVMPEILMGVSLLIFFATIKMQLGYATLVISHTTFCFPFVLLAVKARLAGMDASLEEAAMDLGATPRAAFIRVILPYLRPAIVSGALMSFTLSLDELIISYFVAGPDRQTLPMKVFSLARTGQNATLNAVSTLLILGTCVFVAVITVLNRRSMQ